MKKVFVLLTVGLIFVHISVDVSMVKGETGKQNIDITEEDYTFLFPQAMPGWTASKAEYEKTTEHSIVLMLPYKRVKVARSYLNEKTKGKIHILIDTEDLESSGVIKMAHDNKEFLTSYKGRVKLYRLGGYKGLELYGEDKNQWGIWLNVLNRTVITIGRENANLTDMVKYFQKIDIDKIKTFAEKMGAIKME